MNVVFEKCAGLDVHKRTVVASIRAGLGPRPTRSFGTMTADVLALSDWLLAHGVTHVAMETCGRRVLEADLQPAGRRV